MYVYRSFASLDDEALIVWLVSSIERKQKLLPYEK